MKHYKILLLIILLIFLIPALGIGNTRKIEKVHSGDLIELKGGFKAHLTGIKEADKKYNPWISNLRFHQTQTGRANCQSLYLHNQQSGSRNCPR